MVDCSNTLSYLQEVFQPAAGTRNQGFTCLQNVLCPAAIFLTMGGHLTFLPHLPPQSLEELNTVAMIGGGFICLTAPPQTHTHTLSITLTNMEDKQINVILYL